jgi:hypothetical protein
MARGGAVWCGGGWRGRGSGKAACVGGCGALMRNCGGGGVRGGRGLRDGRRPARPGVTPDFPKKTKCIPICMPGSSFMHIVT